MEIWKPYGSYQVSNYGNVKGKKGQLMNLKPNGRGYIRYGFREKDKRKFCCIHSLVLTLFVGECPTGLQCDHKDQNKENNHVDNLHWVTPYENIMNRSITRTDITETDPRLRANILNCERENKKRREQGKKKVKPKGSGYIRKTPSGTYSAKIVINWQRYCKNFKTEIEAQTWIYKTILLNELLS